MAGWCRNSKAAAFSLKTNEISGIVTTQYGYHIIKLSEKIPAKKVEFEKAATDIKEYLSQMQQAKAIEPYTLQSEKDANVEILDPILKATEVPQTPDAAAATPAAK